MTASRVARRAPIAVLATVAAQLLLVTPAPAPPPAAPWLVTVTKTGTGEGTVDGLSSLGATAPGNFATDLTDIHCGSQCVFQVPNTLSIVCHREVGKVWRGKVRTGEQGGWTIVPPWLTLCGARAAPPTLTERATSNARTATRIDTS